MFWRLAARLLWIVPSLRREHADYERRAWDAGMASMEFSLWVRDVLTEALKTAIKAEVKAMRNGARL